MRDVVSGRADGSERALSGARDAALEDLIDAANALVADGVVGLDFDDAVMREANGMMMVTVSGTAVTIAVKMGWGALPPDFSSTVAGRSALRLSGGADRRIRKA